VLGALGVIGALLISPFILTSIYSLLKDADNPLLFTKEGSTYIFFYLWGLVGWIILLCGGLVFLFGRDPKIVLRMLDVFIITGVITNTLSVFMFKNLFSVIAGVIGILITLHIKRNIEEQI
jgi:cytochrome bd-type quinol oxidase subunit 1